MAEEVQYETHQGLPDQQSPFADEASLCDEEEFEYSSYVDSQDDDPYATWDSYSLLRSAYCCSCCMAGGSDDYEYEQDTEHLIRDKYLRGRPMSHLTENPKGKHHRNPLPWSWKGKDYAEGWDEDKRQLDRYLWKEEQAGRRPEFGVRNPKRVMGKKKRKKMKQPKRKITREIDDILVVPQKSKPMPPTKKLKNPHFLLQLRAHARRNRVLDSRRACSCCYAIAVDYREAWRGKVKNYFIPKECQEGAELAADLSVGLPGEEVTNWARVMWDRRWGPMQWDDHYDYHSNPRDTRLGDWERLIENYIVEDNEQNNYEEEQEHGDREGEEEAEEKVVEEEQEEEKTVESEAELANQVADEIKLEEFPALDADGNKNPENVSWENVVHAQAEQQPEQDPDLGPEWAFIARAANGEKVFEIGVSTSDSSSNCTAADWAWVNEDDLAPW